VAQLQPALDAVNSEAQQLAQAFQRIGTAASGPGSAVRERAVWPPRANAVACR